MALRVSGSWRSHFSQLRWRPMAPSPMSFQFWSTAGFLPR
jgi:hypothetical protein